MILGFDDIKRYMIDGNLGINNITENTIRENGLDCRLGNEIGLDIDLGLVFNKDAKSYDKIVIDTHNKESIDSRFKIESFEDSVIISNKNNVLLYTKERFSLPNNIMAFCALRSTIARQGFISAITIVDAGFQGTLTIESFYGGNNPIKIYSNDRFLHVVFAKINSPVSKVYNGIYNGQTGIRLPKVMD